MVSGLYRYVRNPIHPAVVATLAQAVLFGEWGPVRYGCCSGLALLFVVIHEDPTLELTFGGDYGAFRAAVPVGCPRLTPWRPE